MSDHDRELLEAFCFNHASDDFYDLAGASNNNEPQVVKRIVAKFLASPAYAALRESQDGENDGQPRCACGHLSAYHAPGGMGTMCGKCSCKAYRPLSLVPPEPPDGKRFWRVFGHAFDWRSPRQSGYWTAIVGPNGEPVNGDCTISKTLTRELAEADGRTSGLPEWRKP